MGRISNSIELLKTSWGVLKTDKHLAVIPIISAFCSAVVMILMGAGAFATINKTPVRGTNPFDGTVTSTQYQQTPATYIVIVLGYVLMSFVVTFFTAALMAGAHERLTGGSPSLGSAFAKASTRLPQIFGWALINATVGLILRSIAERGGIFGQLLASTLNFAWNVVTWLAVPFIVIEGLGPFAALKHSAEVLRKTWGENLAANVGFGFINLLVMLTAIAIGAVFVAVGLPIVGIALAIVLIAIAAVIISALTGIYRTALFMYAATGYVPQGFDPQILQNAFRKRRLGGLV